MLPPLVCVCKMLLTFVIIDHNRLLMAQTYIKDKASTSEIIHRTPYSSSVLFHMSNSTHNDCTAGESHSKQDAKGSNAKRLQQITFQKINMEESSTLSFV